MSTFRVSNSAVDENNPKVVLSRRPLQNINVNRSTKKGASKSSSTQKSHLAPIIKPHTDKIVVKKLSSSTTTAKSLAVLAGAATETAEAAAAGTTTTSAAQVNRSKPEHAKLLSAHNAPSYRSSSIYLDEIEPQQTTQYLAPFSMEFTRPVFRQQRVIVRPDDDDLEDMLSLKRANPVFDDSDEESLFESPTKRQRTTKTLNWDDRLQEDDIDGFVLSPSSSVIGAH